MRNRIGLVVCRAALVICLGCGLAADAMAQTTEPILVFWDTTQGTDYANDLGNSAGNNGVINILGGDGINTLTITAMGAGTLNGPDALITRSSQNGLIVQNPDSPFEAWWRNGNYMDVQFSLTGPATQLFINGGVFNWFNTQGNGGGEPEPGGTGEALLIKNMSQGGTLLATLDHTSITAGLGLDSVLIDGLGLEVPLGVTIRLEAQNTVGGWPEDTWLTRLTNFFAVTPSTLTADFDGDNDVDGADFLFWQRNLGDATNLANWQNEYGMSAPLSANIGVVPEPSSFGLLVGCLLLGTWRGRRNRGATA